MRAATRSSFARVPLASSAVTALLVALVLAQPARATGAAPSVAAPSPAATSGAPALGVLTVVPKTGNDQTAFALVTSQGCPSGGTNVLGTIFGPGLPTYGVNIVPNTTAALFPHTAAHGLYMPSNNTLRNLVNDLPDPKPLKGTYRLRVQCRGPAKIADLGDFTGSMTWDGHHGYVAVEPNVPASSLVTVAPVTDPPIPSAAPGTGGTATPAAAAAKKTPVAPKSSGLSGAAPWIVVVGILLTAFGLSTFIRGRRSASRRSRTTRAAASP